MLTHGHDFELFIPICEEVRKIYRDHSHCPKLPSYHIIILIYITQQYVSNKKYKYHLVREKFKQDDRHHIYIDTINKKTIWLLENWEVLYVVIKWNDVISFELYIIF